MYPQYLHAIVDSISRLYSHYLTLLAIMALLIESRTASSNTENASILCEKTLIENIVYKRLCMVSGSLQRAIDTYQICWLTMKTTYTHNGGHCLPRFQAIVSCTFKEIWKVCQVRFKQQIIREDISLSIV